jgi:hypothetical protein
MTGADAVRGGLEGFDADVARWHAAVPGRVPGYHRLLDEVLCLLRDPSAAGAAARARLEGAWRARSFVTFYDRPLLLLAALRAEALGAGARHPLWAALAAEPPDPAAVTSAAVAEALGPAWPGTADALATRFVQTNETSRAVAWLWPAHLVAGERRRPIALVDLGASAGLNLVADRLPPLWTSEDGAPLPVVREGEVDVRLRLGLDRNPLDLHDEAAARWLRACVWPGERDRQARLEAALAAMRAAFAAPGPPRVETADAATWPDHLAAIPAPAGGLVIAYHTIVVEYFPPDLQRAHRAGMARWIAARAPGEALWLELEHDGAADPLPAALRATYVEPGGALTTATLGRCGPHPGVVRVDEAGAGALRVAFRG